MLLWCIGLAAGRSSQVSTALAFALSDVRKEPKIFVACKGNRYQGSSGSNVNASGSFWSV